MSELRGVARGQAPTILRIIVSSSPMMASCDRSKWCRIRRRELGWGSSGVRSARGAVQKCGSAEVQWMVQRTGAPWRRRGDGNCVDEWHLAVTLCEASPSNIPPSDHGTLHCRDAAVHSDVQGCLARIGAQPSWSRLEPTRASQGHHGTVHHSTARTVQRVPRRSLDGVPWAAKLMIFSLSVALGLGGGRLLLGLFFCPSAATGR